ncbi:rab-like protein 6 [Paramacrobiotus metropolitanus]|uniref:rab-like protein 6 n=1 Tax=Paramacrobiotus metropolitanus TaxID=2943436 RepID=UPI00244586DD|nr:rab-like protein 6 [Paramacrobiotus metropolitanus]
MFSKLKKLVAKDESGRQNGSQDLPTPSQSTPESGSPRSLSTNSNANSRAAGMRSMEPQLQRKFARGVQYNMKILVRGERNVGKSCLLARLQGGDFREEYRPSEEIQIGNISWNFKTTDDVVKVEVWDVVDKGRKKKLLEGLKLTNSPAGPGAPGPEEGELGLDAETLDVYKGAHGVILMMDWSKMWTFEYVRRELDQVPPRLPILIFLNFRDLHTEAPNPHSTITLSQVQSFVQHLPRPKGAAPILVAEASMRNGFGLKYLHKFFNLPFLQLQREALTRQLEQNRRDMELTFRELESLSESEEQNYERFLCSITNRKWVPKESPAPPVKAADAPPLSPSHIGATSSFALPIGSPKKPAAFALPSPEVPASHSRVKNVDDFIPDDTLSGEFLEDAVTPTAAHPPGVHRGVDGSSDEEDAGNPMVAAFQDEIDVDETAAVQMAMASVARHPPPAAAISAVAPLQLSLESVESDGEEAVPAQEVFRIDDDDTEEEQQLTPVASSIAEKSPVEIASPEVQPSGESAVQFSAEELSSWLGDLETRAATPPPPPPPEVPAPVENPVKKKKKTKKSKESEKSGRKKSGKTAAPVAGTGKPAVRKSSQADEESMARELEEFLASDDD